MSRALVVMVMLLGLAPWPLSAGSPQMAGSADLDGDGQAEQIRVEMVAGGGGFHLTVAGITVSGSFTETGEDPDGFVVVDIDRSDRFTEVAVHSPGPSDDDEYLVYWYDGNELRESGRLARWPEFPGWGFVYVDGWNDFWRKRDKYRLDKTSHRLRLVPQELYSVGVEATVRESFPIYQTREATAEVARLRTGSQCLLLVCDPSPERWDDHWYLIRSTSGLVGWARYHELRDRLDLPFAD